MKRISYNVNGIRAALKKGLFEWIESQNIDSGCLQEVKAMQEQVDLTVFEEAGYHVYWHAAEKKGYSGVAILTKKQPERVCQGISIEKYDREGRVLRADIGDLTILNCYFPSGTTGDIRQDFKYEFLDDFNTRHTGQADINNGSIQWVFGGKKVTFIAISASVYNITF